MKKKFLAVVYKELERDDGFIITAYFTSKIKLKRGPIMEPTKIENTLKEVYELVSPFIKLPETKMWIE